MATTNEIAQFRQRVCDKLNALGQQHITAQLAKLSPASQEKLLRQADTLDYSVLNPATASEKRGTFSPLHAVTLPEIEAQRSHYEEIGFRAIREGKVGAVLLAGGHGSRLAFDHPKGMFNIGETRTLYIFECLIRNLLRVTEQAQAFVPLFIMTSEENDAETRRFFAENNCFGYSSRHISFFVQEQLPTLDTDGKLMLAEHDRIATAPNGNGGWYASMERAGILKVIRQNGIEWLNVFAVDNVLQSIADPCFIGAVIDSGKVSGAKVVAKADPEEKVGVLCLEDGRPSIVEYYEMTEEMRTLREPDGTLSYNYGVILNYLFRTDRLEQTLSQQMPLHRAFKPIKYLDAYGKTVLPEEPNAYKFETLALDMVKMQESCLAFEVDRNREFAPVKNRTGVDSVDSARALLRLNGVQL